MRNAAAGVLWSPGLDSGKLLQQPVLTAGLQAAFGLKKRLGDLLSLIPAL